MTPARRGLTVGLVLTITLVAFEALAVITILPAIKDDLGGVRLYGWVTSAFQLGVMVGIVVAGGQADRRGPAWPLAARAVVVLAGLGLGRLAGFVHGGSGIARRRDACGEGGYFKT